MPPDRPHPFGHFRRTGDPARLALYTIHSHLSMNTSRSLLVTLGATALAFAGVVALADSVGSSQSKTSAAGADAALLKRGEYLVHGIGLCADCHSPRNPDGSFVAERHLTGSAIPFAPTVPMPAWAAAAPGIAGLPTGWDDEAMVRFLTTGERPNNLPISRPPMPPYRMNRGDAEAVTAYLRSLPKPAL